MALNTYLPTKLNSEMERFKNESGNIKIDYRSQIGPSPFLFSTQYDRRDIKNFIFDTAATRVPEEDHITGDRTNYRRYSTDIAFTSDDYQRNVIVLMVEGILLSVVYKSTIYKEKDYVEGALRTLEHTFDVLESNYSIPMLSLDRPYIYNVAPLILESYPLDNVGFIDTVKALALKKMEIPFDNRSTYYETVSQSIYSGHITLEEAVTVDYGSNGSVVSPLLISDDIKNLTYFIGTENADAFFSTHMNFVSSFKKDGSIFSANNPEVLTDTYSNYHLYGSSVNADSDIIGYSLNVSPYTGALIHAVLQSDARDYLTGINPVIGKVSLFHKTRYTGLLSSPFLLLRLDFTEVTDTFSIKINNNDVLVIGDYTQDTFKYLCSKLSDVLYPYGILVIPCKDNKIALDRFRGDTDLELIITTNSTEITTLPSFTSFQYLNSNKTITFDASLHPGNFSFTYIDDPNMYTPEEDPDYPLTYKVKINKDDNRSIPYISPRSRLLVDTSAIKGGVKTFKLETSEGTLTTDFNVNVDMSVYEIIDLISNKIDTFLNSDYSVEKNYLVPCVDIVNNKSDNSSFIKLTVDSWMTLSPSFGGVYQENPDGSRTIVLDQNDGTSVIISGDGPIAIDLQYALSPINLGTTSLNPSTGEFSKDLIVIAVSQGSYGKSLVKINERLRAYGYEAYPLFESNESVLPSKYIGVSKVISGNNATKLYVGGGANREDFYENLVYKSAKGLYTQRRAIKDEVLENNASVDEWLSRIIPDQITARPFEINHISTSMYGKKTLDGTIAMRDSLQLKRRVHLSDSFLSISVNPLTDPSTTCRKLLSFLAGFDNESLEEPSVNGDVYSLTYQGTSLSINKTTGDFTISYNSSSLYLGLDIGFDQENDIVFDYDGWFSYPYGYNSEDTSSSLFETSAKAKFLIVAFSESIDEVV